MELCPKVSSLRGCLVGAHWGEQSLSACPGSLLLSQPGAKNSKVPLGVVVGRLGSHGNVEDGGKGHSRKRTALGTERLRSGHC